MLPVKPPPALVGYLCYLPRPQVITKISYECRWGFNWQHTFIRLVYNSGDQNALINDWYACFHVLSKQLK